MMMRIKFEPLAVGYPSEDDIRDTNRVREESD